MAYTTQCLDAANTGVNIIYIYRQTVSPLFQPARLLSVTLDGRSLSSRCHCREWIFNPVYMYIYTYSDYRIQYARRACRRARRQNCQLKSGSEAKPCVINTGAAQRPQGDPVRHIGRSRALSAPSPRATSPPSRPPLYHHHRRLTI